MEIQDHTISLASYLASRITQGSIIEEIPDTSEGWYCKLGQKLGVEHRRFLWIKYTRDRHEPILETLGETIVRVPRAARHWMDKITELVNEFELKTSRKVTIRLVKDFLRFESGVI